MIAPMTGKARKTLSRRLRRDMTEAEKVLWRAFRARQFHGLKVRRQHPIGPFIADFAIIERRLIIEADGGQHDVACDHRRTAYLEAQGWIVVRYWNNEILENLEGVLEDLATRLSLSPS